MMTSRPTPKEIFLLSASRIYCFADSVDLCVKLLDAGARVIQLRNKTLDDVCFRRMAREMLTRTRRHEDAVLIINDRVDIALEIGADGIHVGQQDEDCEQVIRRVPAEMIVGVSARHPELALAAQRKGATYVGAGSVAATSTKPDAEVVGFEGLSAVVAAVNIPVVAIGGISKRNIRQVHDIGVRYCAVISGINCAPDPAAALRQLEAILSPFPPGKQTKPA
ncbi:MAG: thiamine phosphate synthase [Desulfobacterales bacterium]|jgi:thiamine-phosphate pyrophosphorylase